MNTAITDTTLSSNTIFATPVADEQRPGFWPQHFGTIPQWILLEPRIFVWMDRFCADYIGVSGIFTRSAMAALLWCRILSAMRNGNSLTA